MLAGRRIVALKGHRRIAEGVGHRMMVRPVGVGVIVTGVTVVVVPVMAMSRIRSDMGVIVMRRDGMGSLSRRRVGVVAMVLVDVTVRNRRGMVIVLG
jgi:hypothetical protein